MWLDTTKEHWQSFVSYTSTAAAVKSFCLIKKRDCCKPKTRIFFLGNVCTQRLYNIVCIHRQYSTAVNSFCLNKKCEKRNQGMLTVSNKPKGNVNIYIVDIRDINETNPLSVSIYRATQCEARSNALTGESQTDRSSSHMKTFHRRGTAKFASQNQNHCNINEDIPGISNTTKKNQQEFAFRRQKSNQSYLDSFSAKSALSLFHKWYQWVSLRRIIYEANSATRVQYL